MKKLTALVAGLCVLGIAAPTVSLAAKGEKKSKKGDNVFATFDKNNNGILDDDEKAALKKAFDSGDASVKKLDINGDGKLDDSEIAAVQPGKKKKKNK